eukprot:m.153301 g.153301  ORF g.153301 m.153301 type:complete len:123 (+) comp14286_c0_seq1:133-501(+)
MQFESLCEGGYCTVVVRLKGCTCKCVCVWLVCERSDLTFSLKQNLLTFSHLKLEVCNDAQLLTTPCLPCSATCMQLGNQFFFVLPCVGCVSSAFESPSSTFQVRVLFFSQVVGEAVHLHSAE